MKINKNIFAFHGKIFNVFVHICFNKCEEPLFPNEKIQNKPSIWTMEIVQKFNLLFFTLIYIYKYFIYFIMVDKNPIFKLHHSYMINPIININCFSSSDAEQ